MESPICATEQSLRLAGILSMPTGAPSDQVGQDRHRPGPPSICMPTLLFGLLTMPEAPFYMYAYTPLRPAHDA